MEVTPANYSGYPGGIKATGPSQYRHLYGKKGVLDFSGNHGSSYWQDESGKPETACLHCHTGAMIVTQ